MKPVAISLICLFTIATQPDVWSQERAPGANNRDRQNTRNTANQNAGHANAGQKDSALSEYFAGRLMLMNHSTIQMASMAARQSSSEPIQQFARTLHEEHAELNRRLSEVAPGIVAITSLDSAGKPQGTLDNPKPPRERSRDVGQRDQQPVTRTAAKPATDGSPLHQILTIDREATDNYIQSSSEMLSKYQGQDFDMGFLGFQIGAHTWALAELNAIQMQGDEQLKPIVDEAIQLARNHLKEAHELSKKYEDQERRGKNQ